MRRSVLLIGATGTFGSRLAAILATFPEMELILAGRHLASLASLRETLLAAGFNAVISIRVFDRSHPQFSPDLRPWLVVDAAGPFQASDYRLPLAAAAIGAHYVDLADARGFVAGFPAALNTAAIEASVLAVTAASSTPALSHAALEHLVEGWRELDDVVVAISPGARAPRGLSVVQAILSYVGRPVRVFARGEWRTRAGWSGTRWLDMPGLGRRLGSLCETPDLALLPQRFPIGRNALFLAGLELPTMHRGLALLGLLVRWRIVPTLEPLARPLRWIADRLAPFGSDRGGMIVQASGTDEHGDRIEARWALWAEANAGPSTPAAPAAALIRALLGNREPRRGALPCVGLLTLEDILRELVLLPIHTRIDLASPHSPVLFRRLLGRRLEAMPPSVRQVHDRASVVRLSGPAVARIGRRWPARLLRRLLGLPVTGHHRTEVTIAPDSGGETWTRRFGSEAFSSRLTSIGRLGVFQERFGPLAFVFDLRSTPPGVVWHLLGWKVLGIPAPRWLAPLVRARGEDDHGRYRFRVVVAHRWTGLLFAYRGTLA